MAAFEYVAVDPGGKKLKGVISAESPRAARRELRQKKLTPLSLSVATERKDKADAPFSSLFADRPLPASELAMATRQLATLVRAGAPVEEALRAVALQNDAARLRKTLLSVRAGVVEGFRMSESMGRQGKAFSPLYRSMVAAGETSGGLGEVMERLADFLERSQQIQRKVTAALIYPAALAFVAIAVIIALMVFVVPRVVEQFDSIGQDLPLLTRSLIVISEGLQAYGLYALIALVAGGFFIGRALRSEVLRKRVDAVFLKLPIVGKVLRNVSAARFARTMSVLTASGSPVLESIEASSRTLNNLVFRDAVRKAAVSVREGGSLSAALRQTEVFPPLLVYLAASGENSGELPSMLEKAAEYLESEFEATTTIALNLLEPAIIITMGAIVTMIVLAILMPILQLNTLALM